MTGNCIHDGDSRPGQDHYCVLNGIRRRARLWSGANSRQIDLDNTQEIEHGR